MATSTPSPPSLPKSMKAIQFSTTSGDFLPSLRFNSSANLPPTAHSLAPDTILVQVLTAALNPVEYKLLTVPFVKSLFIKPDSTPGMDFAGRCVSASLSDPSVPTDPKPGDLVFGRLASPLAARVGTLAEYTVVPRAACVRVPEGVEVDEAAGIGTVGLTAFQSIVPFLPSSSTSEFPDSDRGQRQRQRKVFINGGSGGVGTFGIQIAKAMGCHVVTSCSTGNVELCKGLGADKVIDYKTQDLVDELVKVGGFDLAVDNVNAPQDLYWQAHRFMNVKEGRWVQVGSGISFGEAVFLCKKVLWPAWLGGGQLKLSILSLTNLPKDFTKIADWMAEGKVRCVVEGRFRFDLEGVKNAYATLMAGHAKGKVLVEVGKHGT